MVARAQSGGPTVAINASLAGIDAWKSWHLSVWDCLWMRKWNPWHLKQCLLNRPRNYEWKSGISGCVWKQHRQCIWVSRRLKLPDYLDDDSSHMFLSSKQFELYNVGAFFYIGGNDSMDTVLKLSEYGRKIGSNVRIIGIQKQSTTMSCETDHTPGFGSAAKYIASSVLQGAHDTFIYAIKECLIVVSHGRDAGWLTAAAALAKKRI